MSGADSGELARRVAHAIRTPMGVVGGALDQLRDGNSPVDRGRLLELADRGLAQIGRLADRLGLLGAIERGLEPRPVPNAMRPVVEAAIAEVGRARRRRGVEVVFVGEDDAQRACDAQLLRAAISELVDNAVRFAKTRATVELDGPTGTVSVRNDGPEVEAAALLALSGTRAPAADRAGLGIGLWIAGRIVAAHGGSIEHARTDDVTTFRIVLGAP